MGEIDPKLPEARHKRKSTFVMVRLTPTSLWESRYGSVSPLCLAMIATVGAADVSPET